MSFDRKTAATVGVLVAMAACVLQAEEKEPPYTRFTSYFDRFSYDEKALLRHDQVSLLSETTAFSLHRAPRSREFLLFESALPPGPATKVKGIRSLRQALVPTVLYARTAAGIKAFEPGATIDGASLVSPWLLLSAAGDDSLPFDSPTLIVLGRRPEQVVFQSRQVVLARYATPDTGWIARMSLYGWYKPGQKGKNWLTQNKLPDRNPKTWQWRERFPDDVADRCDWWAGVCRAFPIRCRETFSVDRSAGTVTTRLDYQWLMVEDDWKTEPRKLAPIQPMLGLTVTCPGFPIEFRPLDKLKDPDYLTAMGPFIGFEDTDRVEYTIPIGRYIDQVLDLDKSKLTTEIDKQALANIEAAMVRKFQNASRWPFDFQGVNFVWEAHADYWYAQAIPLMPKELAARARSAWQLYMSRIFLDEHQAGMGWLRHRGRLILDGPGSGSWGGFDDRGKLGSTTLISVWAYAFQTGDWDLIRDRWNLVRAIENTDLVTDYWQEYARKSHAEWGDIGPPCMALARMAWQVGDYDTYLYQTFLAARQMVGHWAVWNGGKYFRDRGPYSDEAPMPDTILPSNFNLWTGWWLNGQGYIPRNIPQEPQWENIIVRFAFLGMGRFYKDWMDKPLRRYLDDPAFINGDRDKVRESTTRESHIRPSYLRIWGLCTTAPQEEVATKGPWQNWRGGAGHIGGNYALLLSDANAHKLVRVVPPGPPTEFIAGHERQFAGKGWGGNATDRWLEDHTFGWANTYFAGKNMVLQLGRLAAVAPPGTVAADGEQILDRTVVARWRDYVTPNPTPGPTGQFDAPWAVIGPFDNSNDDAIERLLGPEQKLDLAARYTRAQGALAGHEPLRWVQVQAKAGVIDTRAVCGGFPEGLAYHLQYVHAPVACPATLIVGHHGASKVFLNGQEVFYRHFHHYPYAEHPVAVQLKEGWNTLLIKSASRRGGWRTSGRIIGLDGQPMNGLQYAAVLPGRSALPQVAATAPPPSAGSAEPLGPASHPPGELAARVIYATPAGQEITLQGRFIVENWPIVLDGQRTRITKAALTGPPGYHIWMERQPDGRFIICTLQEVMTAKMELTSIPVVGATPAALPDGTPVTFVCASNTAPALLAVDRIIRIDFGE